jgi:hypothetical protein
MPAMRSKVQVLTLSSLVAAVVLASGVASATPVASGNNFVVNATAAACAANAECKVDLRLEAGAGFHVNAEYPYKFKAQTAGGVTFLGKDPTSAETFSKAAGDFVLDANNVQVGTMSVRFKSANKGSVSIAGVFKLSVCSASNCQLEQANVTVPVTVQ